jgi:hypothetical protein
MDDKTPSLQAGDDLARTLMPIIKTVARALPPEEQRSFLLGFVAHLFGFLAARHGVQITLGLIDDIRPIVERIGHEQERTRH